MNSHDNPQGGTNQSDLSSTSHQIARDKQIEALEAEYVLLETDQKNILYSNEEMLQLKPNDKDCIESRFINLKCYENNSMRMKTIKETLFRLKEELSKGVVNKEDIIAEITL